MEKHELIVNYGNDAFQMAYAVMEAIDAKKMIGREMKIAIKPNLVVAKPSESGATTSPGLVEGVIKYLKDNSFSRITIMESSWLGGSTKSAFRICGYDEISKKYSVPLIDLKDDPVYRYSHGGIDMRICKSALESDFLINMPVLKAHCQTLITCALKNLKGCIPDSEKRHFHSLGLHKPIAILNKFLKSSLIIVDGIMGDLTFEEGGTPVRMDRVIAGLDPVLVDTYAASLLGYLPQDIDYITEAEKLGVGSTKLDDSHIVEINKDKKPSGKIVPNPRISRLIGHIDERHACSACLGSLIHALYRIDKAGGLGKIRQRIAVGQGFRGIKTEGIGVGNCTAGFSYCIPGCPPKAIDIVNRLSNKS